MKRNIYIVFVLVCFGCSSTLTYNQAVEDNREKFQGSDMQSDAQYLVEAKSFSLLEEKLAQLAIEKGYAAAVQAYAGRIAGDHRKMNEEIDDLADKRDIKVPETMSAGHNQTYEELRLVDRGQFDSAFVSTIEDVYEGHINFLKLVATSATNDDIRAFAARYLGLVQRNEEGADKLQRELL